MAPATPPRMIPPMLGRAIAPGITLCAACLCPGACRPQADAADRPGPAPREFRAAWVATVGNIDWPSQKGLPVDQQRRELEVILDRAQALRLNALIFQVRPSCDAFYPSTFEPWSEWLCGAQGKAPDPPWDPLQAAIDGAQARGLELHAWFNPYRARHAQARSNNTQDHVVNRPGLTVRYGDQMWLDPGVPAAQEHSLDVILDVVRRYDIDGVHLDDYFYPYPVSGTPFPDDASFRAYRAAGGALARADWRRANVDGFIERLYRSIKQLKPWVKFGISPFGIARPGIPEGIAAGVDQYDQLYADVRKWLAEGWCDYMAPQLYWPIAQKPQSYPVLLHWWASQNPKRRHLWIGNYTGRVAQANKRWPVDEVFEQIRLTRAEPGATGNIHFSMKALRDDARGVRTALRAGPYALPALVPASTWLDDAPPAAPDIEVDATGPDAALEIRWNADPDARWRAIYLRCADRWLLIEAVDGRKSGIVVSPAQRRELAVEAVAVSSVDRCGNESGRAVHRLR